MKQPDRMRRHYAPEFEQTAEPQRIGSPRPGFGTVYVVTMGTGDRTHRVTWSATWEDPYDEPNENGEVAGVETVEGNRDDVLAWVRSRPAAGFLMPGARGWLPLPERDEDIVLDERNAGPSEDQPGAHGGF